jgi:hypothetical protein
MTYRIDLRAVRRGYDRVECWVQARAGIIPVTTDSPSIAVLTMQKLKLTGSDDYGALHSLFSTDGGVTWSEPVLQKPFERQVLHRDEYGPIERVVCDFSPQWHAASGVMLGTGHTAQYSNNRVSTKNSRITPYATYNVETQSWNPWRELQMPAGDKFVSSGAGCTQRVDLENGEILLPIYFGGGTPYRLTSTVLRCSFDGETLEYLEHGSELTCADGRGLYEPSLTRWGGRFFLTLRNDLAGYAASSEDGLHFSEPQRWRFDDGEELGSYNTQQHWVTHKSGLYLAYTRRGMQNDHVFRNRAPILMAQVDPDRLCILRETEQVIIPNRGARLGNFGVTPVTENEIWVVETEWMQNVGATGELMLEMLRGRLTDEKIKSLASTPSICGAIEQFGADNSVWTARILWNDAS